MRLSRRVPTPHSPDMEKTFQPQMDTDEHGFPPCLPVPCLFFLSVSIRVHPWLKKILMVWLSFSFWLLTVASASAQLAPADDFFHSGAQAYITNNVAHAKEIVTMGRKLYPEDEKLKKLEELLNQKQQQQQQNQDQQQQNQQDKSEQQKSDDKKNQQQQQPDQKDQKPEEKKPDEQKPEDKKDQQTDQKKDEQQPKPEEKKDSPDKPKDEEAKPGEAQPVKPREMSPEEAKRLLDAQKGNEQLLQLKPQEKPKNSSRPIKDW